MGKDVARGFEIGIRSGADRIGKAATSAMALPVMNAGGAGYGGGTNIENMNINVPPAPGYDGMGDARVQAENLGRELARRGQGAL
jgi:hypothetical protein